MNEQIEKIYGQACIDAGNLDEKKFCEHFAKLLIQECAGICYDEDCISGSGYARAIMKNFGVTE